jgi:PncC family amidohydrolase
VSRLKAELLAIGSELLGPLRAETNSLWLTERLLDAGIEVTARVTLADDAVLLESAVRAALARADVVIATGGLGPTADDLTREAVAGATARGLRREGAIVEALRARFARYGRPMSETNLKQADVIEGAEARPNPRGTAPGQVELHLVAHADGEAEAETRIEELASVLRDALPGRIFSEDGRELPQVVTDLLRERSLTLALAESCTGGLLSARLTDVPGVSAVLDRAVVTYANRAKVEALGVDAALVERHGAVSEEVASAMAAGIMKAARSDIGVAITGIAGPDGGTSDKPVGLVFVAICGAAGTRVRRNHFPGGRGLVRQQATQIALEMLRRGLLGLAPL